MNRGVLTHDPKPHRRRHYALIAVAVLLTLGLWAPAIEAQVCANPGKDGPGGTLGGVVNTYYPGSANANAGATSISIGTSTGSATAIATGDLLLVIQMQDAAINSNNSDSYGDGTSGGTASGYTSLANAGKYEFVVATSAAGGSVSIRGAGSGNGLANTYTNAVATSSRGARRFQVVRVPQYSSATLGSTLTALPWNGATGGILAIDVAGNLGLGGASVSVNGMGFRGGAARQLAGGSGGSNTDYRNVATSNYHGGKGEGVAGTPRYVYDSLTDTVTNTTVEGYPNGSTARGAPGNAGGGGTDGNPTTNDQNSGGGGGSNWGAGGVGGNTWTSNLARGGYGGVAIPDAANLIVPGGGGGGGSRNNSSGNAGSGGNGGGIVLIRAGTVSGSGSISANGNDGTDAENDGAGGGGAGGSVIVVANGGTLGSLSINARGGNGGDAWPTATNSADRHGPGGGGGGGFIAVTSSAGMNVNGGTNGITTTLIDAYGATAGGTGSTLAITASSIPGAGSGAQCVPSLTTTKTTSTPSVTNTPTGVNATYAITIANAANRSTAANLSISDTLPTGFTYLSTGTVTLTGSATRPSTSNPTVGDAVPNWGTFSIPGGGSVVLNFTAKLAYTVGSGTYQNPATATYTDPGRTTTSGTTTSTYNSASSTGEDVTVIGGPNVSLVKSVSPSGPQIPGTNLVFTIAFSNGGGSVARSLVITDPVPGNTDFKVGSVTNSLGTTGLTVAVAYSNNSGSTWTYTPLSGGGGAPSGYDRNVTNIRWTFTGNLSQTSPNNAGSVNFTVRIR